MLKLIIGLRWDNVETFRKWKQKKKKKAVLGRTTSLNPQRDAHREKQHRYSTVSTLPRQENRVRHQNCTLRTLRAGETYVTVTQDRVTTHSLLLHSWPSSWGPSERYRQRKALSRCLRLRGLDVWRICRRNREGTYISSITNMPAIVVSII